MWINKKILCVLCLTAMTYEAGGVYGSSTDGAHNATVTVDKQEVNLQLGENFTAVYTLHGFLSECITITLCIPEPDRHLLLPAVDNMTLYVCNDHVGTVYNITMATTHEGRTVLVLETDSEEVDVSEAFVSVAVMKDSMLNTVADVMGWISTIAWDISFLPQIWHNYRRYSVEGLSFDFLAFNFLGFSCYLVFNAALFWSQAMQNEYNQRHSNEILHVRLNDVVFPLYAVLSTAVQIVQCFFYKRSPGQRVSTTCRIINAVLLVLVLLSFILVAAVPEIWWLDSIYFMSYVKLFISMIKYTPQLYTNYKAKSTDGWSIGQVILDFTGGTMSLVQMFLIADNYDDMTSVLTDPTKLGLGILAIFFNVFFFIQHYCQYRNNTTATPEIFPEKPPAETTNSVTEKDGEAPEHHRF